MFLPRVVALSVLPAVLLTTRAGFAQSAAAPRERIATISSSASADAKFTPDRATISIAVETKASTAAAAAAENAKKQSAVLSSLRSLGLTNEELSTTGYSVSPEYRYAANSSPTLTGYTVTNTVQADVHDLKQIGRILDTALANGSNMISSLAFYASNTDAAREQAVTDAVMRARGEAQVAARAAGGSLGTLVHLSVGGGDVAPPRPMFMAKDAVARESVATQINPGQQTLTMSVSADWQFVPGH